MTILTEFAYFEKKSTFRTHPESPEKGMRSARALFRNHSFFDQAFLSGRHVRPTAADRGHMLPSACHVLCLDTCLPGRLHHDDGEKARPFPLAGKGRQGRFSCLMTCRGQEANGFQQHNHFKRRRVWRIGRTTRLPTRRPAVWQNDLNSVPHRSSSVLSLRSCLAVDFPGTFVQQTGSACAVQP